MNVLIVGCGRVGLKLVQMLESTEHDVAVVSHEADELAALAALNPPFGGVALRGVPIDVDLLRSAGIEMCDAVVALTKDDNINAMVAQMAKTVFNVETVITRVTDPYLKGVFSERFGLHAVCGTNLTANAIFSGLMHLDNDETFQIAIGSSAATLIMKPVTPEQIGRQVIGLKAPRPGMMVFGVWRANGIMQLAVEQTPTLSEGDKIVYAVIAD